MAETKYLIVGSSHAGLEAVDAIRLYDEDGALTLLSRDEHLPYSPTVLPYIVSGVVPPERVVLRDQAFFSAKNVGYVPGASVTAVCAAENTVRLADGEEWRYEKLLLATGASPLIPPIAGLDAVPYHVLRTMADALRLRQAIDEAHTAVVIGAGLIGMHAAQNLAEAGLQVSVIEVAAQVLPGYFDSAAATIIADAFRENGVKMLTGRRAVAVRKTAEGAAIVLDNDEEIEAQLLLVSAGVAPEIGFLAGSGIETDRGILVDDRMRTSADNVWAAGDVAQARAFFGEGRTVNGILPEAVEQGRIAGMAMAEDPTLKTYRGGMPLNTYHFFGHPAVSVGQGAASANGNGFEVAESVVPERQLYRKIVLKDDRLIGISAINDALDAGIMWELILRRVDLGPVKQEFLAKPLETGRRLMSRLWR